MMAIPIRGMAPMETNENRGRYDRSKLRYPSDLTDEEWAFIALISDRLSDLHLAHDERGDRWSNIKAVSSTSHLVHAGQSARFVLVSGHFGDAIPILGFSRLWSHGTWMIEDLVVTGSKSNSPADFDETRTGQIEAINQADRVSVKEREDDLTPFRQFSIVICAHDVVPRTEENSLTQIEVTSLRVRKLESSGKVGYLDKTVVHCQVVEAFGNCFDL